MILVSLHTSYMQFRIKIISSVELTCPPPISLNLRALQCHLVGSALHHPYIATVSAYLFAYTLVSGKAIKNKRNNTNIQLLCLLPR